MKKRLGFLPILLLLAADTSVAWEGDARGLSNRFNLSLGTFLVDFDTQMRADSLDLGLGTVIDFEDDLNMERDAADFRLDGFFRISPRHHIDFGWFQFNRSTSVFRLGRDIQFGERIFAVDTEIGASTRSRIIKASYQYAFLKKARYEVTASLGMSFIDNRLTIFGEAFLDGERNDFEREGEESKSSDLPVPLLGFHGTWAWRPNLVFRGDAEYFYIDYEEYTGSYFDARADLIYYPFRHFGFGLGYNLVELDVDVAGKIKNRVLEFTGLLRHQFSGFRIFGTVTF